MEKQRIERIKEKVLKSGELDLSDRYEIWLGFGESKYRKDKNEIRAVLTEGLKKRIQLAEVCIRKVLFVWEEKRKKDYCPWYLLQLVHLYIEGNVTAEQLEKEAENFAYYIVGGDWGEFYFGRIGFLCIELIDLALKDRNINKAKLEELKRRELKDEDLEEEKLDIEGAAARAYIYYDEQDRKKQGEKEREFWNWYVEEVIKIEEGEEKRKECLEREVRKAREKVERTGYLTIEEQKELQERLLPIKKEGEEIRRGENRKKRVYVAMACVKQTLPLWKERYCYNARPWYLLELTGDYMNQLIKKERLEEELVSFKIGDLDSLHSRPFNNNSFLNYEKREEMYAYIGRACMLVGYMAIKGREFKKEEEEEEAFLYNLYYVEEEFREQGLNIACLSCKILLYDSKEEKEKKEKEKRFWLWYLEKLKEIAEKQLEEIDEIKRVSWRDLKEEERKEE